MDPEQPKRDLPPWEVGPERPPQPPPQPQARPPAQRPPQPQAQPPAQPQAQPPAQPQARPPTAPAQTGPAVHPQTQPARGPATGPPVAGPQTVPAGAGVYGQPAVQGQYYEPYRRTGLPFWGWGLIGCGGLMFLVMIVLVVIGGLAMDSAISDAAKVEEAKSGLHVVKNRLRVYYVQNNYRAYGFDQTMGPGPQYEFNTRDLGGQYYAASDFSVTILGESKASIRASGAAKGSPDVVMRVDDLSSDRFTITVDGKPEMGAPPPEFRFK